jgi:hypothetical protein
MYRWGQVFIRGMLSYYPLYLHIAYGYMYVLFSLTVVHHNNLKATLLINEHVRVYLIICCSSISVIEEMFYCCHIIPLQ